MAEIHNYRGQAVEYTKDGYQCRDLNIWKQKTMGEVWNAIDAALDENPAAKFDQWGGSDPQ